MNETAGGRLCEATRLRQCFLFGHSCNVQCHKNNSWWTKAKPITLLTLLDQSISVFVLASLCLVLRRDCVRPSEHIWSVFCEHSDNSCSWMTALRPCSHHSFGTGTVPERNRTPVFTPVPLRPVVPERADHLTMWSQWNGSGTGPVGSVVWTCDWTRSGTVPVARDIRRFTAHSSYLQTFITSWHLATDRLIGNKSRYYDWSWYLSWSNMRKSARLP